ncbi:MAG: choice-of-anchor D domain-containing protein [Deltaproteobacteria bacterium]|nr:choice-of-anchor D domain-containing protein [Deltaproteobacteria bacterium]
MRWIVTIAAIAAWMAAACEDVSLVESAPTMDLGATRIEFGAVPIGGAASRSIEIQNPGKGDLRLAEPTFEEDPDGVFSVPELDAKISPSDKGLLTVEFRPKGEQRYESRLVIEGNDADHPRAEVIVGGWGYRLGSIDVTPLVVDFGRVHVGAVGVESVLIRSVGLGELVVTEIALAPETHPDFEILSSTQTPATLPRGVDIPLRLAYRPGPDSPEPVESYLFVRSNDPFQPEIAVTLRAGLNRCPVADAGPDLDVGAMETAALDGSASSDPDEDLPLSFAWTLVNKPEGSNSLLADAELEQASLTPDLVGVYEVELAVTDSQGCACLLPDRAVVTAVPAERLLIELVWDSPLADLDLHLLAPGGTLGGPLDCSYSNPAPDWGTEGETEDDPWLKRDDLMGFGPEIIAYGEPVDGVMRLVVHYFSSHTPSGQEPAAATMRVYVNGLLGAEISRALETQGQTWTAAEVLWPEGTVSEVDQLE